MGWYALWTWTLPSCTVCHGAALNSLRQVLGAVGDFEKSCHHVIDYGQMDAGFGATQYPEFCSFQCHWDGTYRYPRSSSNEAKAIAADTSGNGPGLHSGDTVTISFVNSTNGPVLDETNITTVLALSSPYDLTVGTIKDDTGIAPRGEITFTGSF